MGKRREFKERKKVASKKAPVVSSTVATTLKGTKKVQNTKARRIELGLKICKKYGEGEYTIGSVCDNYGVKYDTFLSWVSEGRAGHIQEVQEAYKKAKDTYEDNFSKLVKDKARAELLKRLERQEYTETHKEVTKDAKGKETTKIKSVTKLLVPDTSSVIFALTNKDSDNFQNSHNIKSDVTLTKGKYDDMSLEELEAIEANMRKDLEKLKDDNKKLE